MSDGVGSTQGRFVPLRQLQTPGACQGLKKKQRTVNHSLDCSDLGRNSKQVLEYLERQRERPHAFLVAVAPAMILSTPLNAMQET